MASNQTPIQRSNILRHPLGGGQVGLSRELGLTDRKSGMFHAWSHGIDSSVIWWFKGQGILTNLVYDHATQGAIIGRMKVKKGSSVGCEV